MHVVNVDSPKVSSMNLDLVKDICESQYIASIRDRTVCILDWDDTICPSSWLQSQNLLPKKNETVVVSARVMRKLEKVSRKVRALLKKALSFGPVFVVTAAEHGWVERSCNLYLSSVREQLNHPDVHVISARTWYESQYGVSGTACNWKDEVIQIIATECFASDASSMIDPSFGHFNLISIGDSIVERNACHAAAEATPFTLAKTLKFIERPNVRELTQQIELTMSAYDEICNADSSLDFRVTRSELRAFYGN